MKAGKFVKVSKEEWMSCKPSYETVEDWSTLYEGIQLPKRATTGSAGYDFYIPHQSSVTSHAEKMDTIYMGVRWVDAEDCVLLLVPRSGLGFKRGVRLRNTVGVIDADYCNAKNEGHIMSKMALDTDHDHVMFEVGDRIMQGIIVPFLITEDDATTEARVGGVGSTGK